MTSSLSEEGKQRGEVLGSVLIIGVRTCNSTKLYQVGVRLDIGKHLFTVMMVRCQNRFSRKLVDAPYVIVFRRCLEKALISVL